MSGDDENKLTQVEKQTIRQKRAKHLLLKHRIILFKGDILYLEKGIYRHLTSDQFARFVYETAPLSSNVVKDLERYVRGTTPDQSHLDHYIGFGDTVWDMDTASFTTKVPAEDVIYSTPYVPDTKALPQVEKYLLEVADGDPTVRDDIMQSIAPLFTTRKPAGVIWWQGLGANGKSSTMHLLYHLFRPHLSSITLHQLEDERDTPVLNAKLGNIVGESSEGVIHDSRTYKAIGTHDDFSVHKFNSQDQVTISGNLHHIFSTNNMPIFGDKSNGARRRTLIIKFKNQFPDDPLFEERLFTKDFIQSFLHLCLEAAQKLKSNHYQYKFGEATQQVKEEYDSVVNTAETFAQWMLDQQAQYFENFFRLRQSYEWWCDNNSYQALGKGHLRNAVLGAGFKRSSRRDEEGKTHQIFLREGGTTEFTKELMFGIHVNVGYTPEVKLGPAEEEKAKQEVLDKGW